MSRQVPEISMPIEVSMTDDPNNHIGLNDVTSGIIYVQTDTDPITRWTKVRFGPNGWDKEVT